MLVAKVQTVDSGEGLMMVLRLQGMVSRSSNKNILDHHDFMDTNMEQVRVLGPAFQTDAAY